MEPSVSVDLFLLTNIRLWDVEEFELKNFLNEESLYSIDLATLVLKTNYVFKMFGVYLLFIMRLEFHLKKKYLLILII